MASYPASGSHKHQEDETVSQQEGAEAKTSLSTPSTSSPDVDTEDTGHVRRCFPFPDVRFLPESKLVGMLTMEEAAPHRLPWPWS